MGETGDGGDGLGAAERAVTGRALDAAPIGITLTDPTAEDNPLVYVNEGFERLTGYDEAEALGRNCRFLQGEETDAAPVARLRAAIDEERPVSVELVNYREDGTRFWNAVDVAPVYGRDGELASYVGFQRDVTGRKEARREREAVLGRISDAFFALDNDWRFTYLNKRAEELLAAEADDLLGRSVWEAFEDAVGTTFYEEYHAAMSEQEPRSFVEYYEPLSTWFEVNAYPSETGLSVYFRDVTERREHERVLERRATQFESFADVLAHDLRSPLTAVSGHLELARETGDEDHLDQALDRLERVYELVGDLADVMREGRLVGELDEVELAAAVERCWGTVGNDEADLAVASSRPLRADADALRRLLENLFRNAVEHAGPHVTVRVAATADGFAVEDDGPGIPEEVADDVVEPGFTTGEDGRGFGMASVRHSPSPMAGTSPRPRAATAAPASRSRAWTSRTTDGQRGGRVTTALATRRERSAAVGWRSGPMRLP